ncbi:MAG: hypothetical protein LC792_06655, partial [Actinobacteria bacterium]|nr:hypothetical protein [Actinomycetota bacterium]
MPRPVPSATRSSTPASPGSPACSRPSSPISEVSGSSAEDAELYGEAAFETWAARCRHQCSFDISVLTTRYG